MKFTNSAERVFRYLADNGEATRPQLADALSLSKPTLSTAIAELETEKFVCSISEVQGHTGRKASMYQLADDAGLVVGIDAGSTQVSLSVSTLDRRVLYSDTLHFEKGQSELNKTIALAASQLLTSALANRKVDTKKIRKIGIAVPARVINRHKIDDLIRPLELVTSNAREFSYVYENNVNCAAIAEQGNKAEYTENFAYIQIGIKIGMGLILHNELVRGFNGATGEISAIPFPLSPHDSPVKFEFEHYLSADGFLERAQAGWNQQISSKATPKSLEELFYLGENGDAAALEAIEAQAKQISHLIATCVAVVDPGNVVLGGGVGKNKLLAPMVQKYLDHLTFPTKITTSSIGDDATLNGITEIARKEAIDEILA